MNFKINGVEVEFDFFDMDEKEDFDAIFLTANEKIQKLSNEHKDFDTKFGKAYCEVIVNMFEDLFGEEKTYEIFQGKTNIMKCTIESNVELEKNIINELKYFNRLFTYNNRSSRSAISN